MMNMNKILKFLIHFLSEQDQDNENKPDIAARTFGLCLIIRTARF